MKDSIIPKCKECIHLKEQVIGETGSMIWCDIPNGNRKASKDVGGCDNYEKKN